jgi:hypothetical protein
MRLRIALLLALAFVPRAARAQGGNPLGPEFLVNSETSGNQTFSSVAADPSGNFVVVWDSYLQDGSGFGIFGQRYSSGGAPLGPEFRVNTFTTAAQRRPAVAADGAGNFVVVWMSADQDGSGYGVFGQRYSGAGLPLGPEFRASTFTSSDQEWPSVAADPTGSFIVVWFSQGQDGSAEGVFGQRYASSGAPLGPEFRVNTYTTGTQRLPSVAADSSGNFVVAWESYEQDGSLYTPGIFAQRYASSGAALGPEFRANTYTTSLQSRPSVAALGGGNFLVVWYGVGQGGASFDIFGQRFAGSGAPQGAEFRVNTSTTDVQNLPSVGADATGNFVVAWQGDDGGGGGYGGGPGPGVFAQRYLASGAPEGPEFLVNTYTTDAQAAPHVAAAALAFVVVWDSNLQDTSGVGVFGQRYGGIVPVDLIDYGVK